MKRVITITREFGSGGRTIAKELANRLGWEYYDYSLIAKIAAQSGYAPEYIERHGEDITSWNMWNMGFFSLSDSLFLAQRKVILDLAEKGNCVIVGRCADYILEDRTDVLNVFIYADEAWKKDRIKTIYGENEKTSTGASRKRTRSVPRTINTTQDTPGAEPGTMTCA